MVSLEMVSTQMFECIPRDPRNKKEKDLNVLVRDQFDIFRVFPTDDSTSNQHAKNKEVLECSSRTSVLETEESLQTLSSNSKPTYSSLETNSNPLYNPTQPENPSRNGIIMGATSLVQIWEARSQQSSPTQSQILIDSITSSGNWNPCSSFESTNEEVENNGEEVDWCLQSNMSYVSDYSCEKEMEARCLPPLVRIRGRQAFDDFLMMILSDRKKELKRIAGLYAVSKFSPRGCGRLQYMLRIRCYERCIAVRERHLLKSAKRSSRESGVMKNLSDRYKTNTGKPKIAKKDILSEAISIKNGLKKPKVERKATEEGERSGETTEKAIVMRSVEANNTSLSIAEKVNLWDSKDRRTMGKAARRGIDVEVIEVNKERSKKEEVSSFEERKSVEIDEYGINPQEVTSVISLEKRKEEETESHVSRESGREESFSKDGEETSKAKNQEASETLCLILESPTFLNGWDENEVEGEDEYEDYSGESVYDWVSDISRPRSYWDDLRKQRELEIMKKHSKKDDIFQKLIKERTVSSFLASDFRDKIEKILISRPQKRLEVESNHVDEEASEEGSTEFQEKLKDNETEKVDLETVIVCDNFSQDSAKSTMITWSFEDHEVSATIALDPKDHENTSSETQMVCDLREEIKKLQREMLELKGFVKSCVEFQKFKSVSDSLQRNCSVCFEKPVDSLLYRCGHMCTCLKCGHELQWSTKKCPICMAPIIDVVRAFLDS